MTRDELKCLIKGPIAALPTAFDSSFHVDFGAMIELTHWCMEHGLVGDKAPLKVTAALGEGPDLSDDEWPHILRTVVNAAKGRVAVVCGLKTKNTLHTIEDAKKAQDLGAIGLQIDLPIFHHPLQDDLVRYFSDISDAVDIGVLIYNTYWFGAESISAESMLRLADAEHVVAIKWDVPPDRDYDEMRQFAHIFNVIDNSGQPVRCHRNGGHGYIDPTAAVYPPHALKVWELCEARRYDEAQALIDCVKPLTGFRPHRPSGGYALYKGMLAALRQPVGPPRPPTLPLDDQDVAELRKLCIGFGWLVPQ